MDLKSFLQNESHFENDVRSDAQADNGQVKNTVSSMALDKNINDLASIDLKLSCKVKETTGPRAKRKKNLLQPNTQYFPAQMC